MAYSNYKWWLFLDEGSMGTCGPNTVLVFIFILLVLQRIWENILWVFHPIDIGKGYQGGEGEGVVNQVAVFELFYVHV